MSEEKKINIQVAEGVSEIIIREGTAVKTLDPKAPLKINLSGTIQAPYIFLLKRHESLNLLPLGGMQIDLARTHVLVNRENISITLITNESDEYTVGKIIGSLEPNPKFISFGINQGKDWEPNKLGSFFKMNRAYFPSKEENMDLVTKLKNFKATVNAAIDKAKQESGSFTDNYSATVESNLPGTFKVKMPLFKGFPSDEMEVEFDASVDGRDFTVQLISPGAQQAYDEIRDSIIDEQLKLIAELVPSVPIIEQ